MSHKLRCSAALLWLVLLQACAGLPKDVQRTPSRAWDTPAATALGRLVQPTPSRVVRGDSAFRLLAGSAEALALRLALIQAATRTLDLQYYAIHVDQSTAELVAQLRLAARRGVRVRILLDDLNSVGADAQIMGLSFEPGIEIRMFNPLSGSRASLLTRGLGSLFDLSRAQRRMHNKLFVADNALAVTGGRNLGDAYFGKDAGSNFVDLEVLVAGPLVSALSSSFDSFWNDRLAFPVESLISPDELRTLRAAQAPPVDGAVAGRLPAGAVAAAVAADPLATATTVPQPGAAVALQALAGSWLWAPSAMLADQPAKIAAAEEEQDSAAADPTVVDGLLQLVQDARREVLIVSPYFVPGERMLALFATLRQRGVRVRVLTNSLASNDAPMAHAGYAGYRKRLLTIGVELYELRSTQGSRLRSLGSSTASTSSLHTKAVVIDGRTLVIGSMNLDPRSHLLNTELALVIRSSALAAQAVRQIDPLLLPGVYRLGLVDGRLQWEAPREPEFAPSLVEPDTSLGVRLLLGLLGPLAPEELL